MDHSRLRGCWRILLAACLATALAGSAELAALDPPRVEPDQLTIPAARGKVSFSMYSPDHRLFTEIRLVDADGATELEGVVVGMGRARGERRNASIRTAGATPGVYSVELVDVDGDVVPLDLEVTVEGDEPPELEVPDVRAR